MRYMLCHDIPCSFSVLFIVAISLDKPCRSLLNFWMPILFNVHYKTKLILFSRKILKLQQFTHLYAVFYSLKTVVYPRLPSHSDEHTSCPGYDSTETNCQKRHLVQARKYAHLCLFVVFISFIFAVQEAEKNERNMYACVHVSNKLIHAMPLFKFMHVIISGSCLRHSH